MKVKKKTFKKKQDFHCIQLKDLLFSVQEKAQELINDFLLTFQPAALNKPIETGNLVEHNEKIKIVLDVNSAEQKIKIREMATGENSEIVEIKDVIWRACNISLQVTMDGTTSESFHLQNCFLNFLCTPNPDSFRSLIICFIQSGPKDFQLTRELASSSMDQINNVIKNKETIFLKIPPHDPLREKKPICSKTREEYFQKSQVTQLCLNCYATYPQKSVHICPFISQTKTAFFCNHKFHKNTIYFKTQEELTRHSLTFHRLEHEPSNLNDIAKNYISKCDKLEYPIPNSDKPIHHLVYDSLPKKFLPKKRKRSAKD